MNKTYYYIDYRATIDAIKWRVYSVDKEVQGNTVPQDERTELACPRCGNKYSVMNVLEYAIPDGFLCPNCTYMLESDTTGDQSGHEQSTKYNAQFQFITDMLPKIDGEIIPDNTFEKAFASALKVERDATNPAYETQPLDAADNKPTAVRGMANTGPTSINVTLTTGEGPTEADKAAEQARKEKHAAQNALPQHFTHSTITGEQVKFGQQSGFETSQTLEVDKKGAYTPSANGDEAGIDDYFARLKAEQEREARMELKEEDETDDEDEDIDFEDVPTGSGAGTPALSFGGGVADEEDEKTVKKVKIEEHEESDEDLEFEDV